MTEVVAESEIIETVQTDATDENVLYTEVKDPYGFIYITTNLSNGMRYLGKRIFSKGWETYLGSGAILKKAIKKAKKNNNLNSFRRDIVTICYSDDELNQAEYDLSVFLDVVNSDDWYNLVYGGKGTAGYQASQETREKMSKSRMGEKNPNYGNHKLAGNNHPNYGKPMSEEQKQKIRQTIGDSRKGELNANYGNHKLAGFKNPRCVPVYCIELHQMFWGAKHAEDNTNADRNNICACCNNRKIKSTGVHPITGESLHWKYVYDKTNKDGTVTQGAITLGYITEEQAEQYLEQFKTEKE